MANTSCVIIDVTHLSIYGDVGRQEPYSSRAIDIHRYRDWNVRAYYGKRAHTPTNNNQLMELNEESFKDATQLQELIIEGNNIKVTALYFAFCCSNVSQCNL